MYTFMYLLSLIRLQIIIYEPRLQLLSVYEMPCYHLHWECLITFSRKVNMTKRTTLLFL